MDIKRYESMPFYFKPQGQHLWKIEDTWIDFLDHLVDAHELERNTHDHFFHFATRATYVASNFHRYSNDTVANLMFDTQLPKRDYDRVNASVDQSTFYFYLASTMANLSAFGYGSYFFRFRRLDKWQLLVVSGFYYFAFGAINNTLYKLIVDRNVMSTTRQIGHGSYVQPNGTFRNRGLNY